jgi:tetratricopeptide (TPR) repeat protein
MILFEYILFALFGVFVIQLILGFLLNKIETPKKKEASVEDIGLLAIAKGKQLEENRSFEAALICYETAIDAGLKCYSEIAGCLTALEWNFDAIDYYNLAIKDDPNDCNLYFSRSLSKQAVGDKTAESDLRYAIELSKRSNALIKEYDIAAQEMGFKNTTSLYESHLFMYENFDAAFLETTRKLNEQSAVAKGRRPKALKT